MKKQQKRRLARLTAMLLALTVLLGLGATAAAAEETTEAGYVAKDGYVYHFGSGSSNYQYAQFSPFVPRLTYDSEKVDGYSIIFGLTYNGQLFENLYCTDMPVDAVDANYRPLNLSDSTYAAALANKLRGIVLNTYPCKTVNEVADASGITGLTLSEAITASQLAIWKTAHGENVEVIDFLNFVTTGNSIDPAYQNQLTTDRTNYQNGTDEYRAAVKDRIEALYNYLMARPEQSATKTIVSEASFIDHDTAPTVTENGDGTCTVKVVTTLTAQLGSGDDLTLTAHMAGGQYFTSQKLTGSGTYTLVIQNVPADVANGTVTLAIDGTQKLDDVYLVDAEGIRGASQSMIGALNDTVPVHAETKVEPDRVLQLYKKTSGGNPLAGISFDIYYVGSLDDFNAGTLGIGKTPTDADITKYAKTTNLVGTLTTDSNGFASLNFGTTDGVYLLKELPDDRVTGPCTPFFVVLPWDYGNGNGPYTVTVYPKNELKDELKRGGIELVKVDANNTDKKLAGATFEVYRKATQEEIAADTGNTLPQFTIGETTYKMVQMFFYDNVAMSGEMVTSLTTGEDGKGHIYGLAHGTYYLVETQAPAGYNKLSEPKEFTITASSNGTIDTLTVKNSSGTVLPETGGMGTTFFTAAGLVLMAVPVAALLQRKRTD